MTGRDLIMHILANGLEDVELIKFITIDEAAEKFNVSATTVRVWYELGAIDGIKIGDEIHISPNAKTPLRVCARCGETTLEWVKQQ